MSELPAELASSYESVIETLRGLLEQSPLVWTHRSIACPAGDLMMFAQQLVQSRGIGVVIMGLSRALPELSTNDIETHRNVLDFATPIMQLLIISRRLPARTPGRMP